MEALYQLSYSPEGGPLYQRGVVQNRPGTLARVTETARPVTDAPAFRYDAKLANEKFVANAPEEIVEEEREKREAALARRVKILEAMERLESAT